MSTPKEIWKARENLTPEGKRFFEAAGELTKEVLGKYGLVKDGQAYISGVDKLDQETQQKIREEFLSGLEEIKKRIFKQ